MASDGEVELSPFIDELWNKGITVALPTVVGTDLRFVRYRSNSRMVAGPFNISVPEGEPEMPIEAISLVVVPTVAFASDGSRVGRGGGYYDRAFQSEPRPFLLGVGYEFQCVEQIERQPWDVLLDGFVTEKRLMVLSERHR